METLVALFSDYTVVVVAMGSALLGMVSGGLGSFAVLRSQSLLGDGVSHAALPGVILAFLLIGSKDTEVLLLGGLLSGLLATAVIMVITRYTRIRFDSALAMTLAVFFGLAMVLLTLSQKIPNANQAGLDRFIYGQASAMLKRDVYIIGGCGLVLMGEVVLFWKEFKLLSFDPEFAQTLGIPVRRLDVALTFSTVVAIIIGLQTVGVILMSAMLVAPAVAARRWVNQLWAMVVLAAFFGALSGVVGTVVSTLLPNMPTGPVIVVAISTITAVSLLLGPNAGVVHRLWQRRNNRRKFAVEGGGV